MKFLNVTVPCSFTSDSNEGITEATGWSTSIHPSAMPVKPPHSTPSTWHGTQWHGDRSRGFAIRRLSHLCTWNRSAFYISARSSDVTPEAAEKDQTWRHCIQISMHGRLCISALVYQVCIGTKCLLWRHSYHCNSLGKPSRRTSINIRFLMHCWQVL